MFLFYFQAFSFIIVSSFRLRRYCTTVSCKSCHLYTLSIFSLCGGHDFTQLSRNIPSITQYGLSGIITHIGHGCMDIMTHLWVLLLFMMIPAPVARSPMCHASICSTVWASASTWARYKPLISYLLTPANNNYHDKNELSLVLFRFFIRRITTGARDIGSTFP